MPGARGLRLRVCTWGQARPDRPPILILHGYLEQGYAWDAVAGRLAGQVIAPDHRGHGLSEHVGAGGFYHFWDYVGDVDSLVQQLGGTVDLVGHSMGGTMACLYAGTRPDQVRRLVLIEGVGPPDMVPLAVGRARSFLHALQEAPRHSILADVNAAAARMRRFNPKLPETTALTLARRTTRPVDGGVIWTWDPLHRATSPVPFDPALFRHWLKAITAPTLYIDGAESRFRPPDTGDRLEHIANVQRLTIPRAGHLVHHDTPEALAEAINRWLEAA